MQIRNIHFSSSETGNVLIPCVGVGGGGGCDGGGAYLDVIGCQVSLHVTVLLFGWRRGWLVRRWEVGPVKRVKR